MSEIETKSYTPSHDDNHQSTCGPTMLIYSESKKEYILWSDSTNATRPFDVRCDKPVKP